MGNSGKVILDSASTPEDIESRSFAIIEEEIPEPRPYSGALWQIARRCIHSLGDTSIISDLIFSPAALLSGLAAMRRGAKIYTDTRMLAAGLVRRRMDRLGIQTQALMDLPEIDDIAKRLGITRSRAGIKIVAPQLGGNIMVIGNAPTALLALLEELEKANGTVEPALIVGMPVGFVNAAQSKELLARSSWPHFTLLGRKGGSAVAAACINAMADIILEERSVKRTQI